MTEVELSIRTPVSDGEVNELHAAAFEHDVAAVRWNERLERNSLFWVSARRLGFLIGFVNVIGDGGAHAVLLVRRLHFGFVAG
jgi:hypothetical protein